MITSCSTFSLYTINKYNSNCIKFLNKVEKYSNWLVFQTNDYFLVKVLNFIFMIKIITLCKSILYYSVSFRFYFRPTNCQSAIRSVVLSFSTVTSGLIYEIHKKKKLQFYR